MIESVTGIVWKLYGMTTPVPVYILDACAKTTKKVATNFIAS